MKCVAKAIVEYLPPLCLPS